VPLKDRPEANAEPEWVLVLDHNEDEGEAVRPNFDPMAKHGLPLKKMVPLAITPDVLVPIKLDALTVAGDSTFFKKVAGQMNLPDYIKTGLKKMYSDL
jgi:5-methylthioadenosine/S-adenosylhomocysteine deaminase